MRLAMPRLWNSSWGCGMQTVRVTPVIATIADDNSAASTVRQELDASAQLPAEPSAHAEPQLVIGTLDINVCAKLPSEELIGEYFLCATHATPQSVLLKWMP